MVEPVRTGMTCDEGECSRRCEDERGGNHGDFNLLVENGRRRLVLRNVSALGAKREGNEGDGRGDEKSRTCSDGERSLVADI